MRINHRARTALLPLAALSALAAVAATGCGTTAPVAGAAYDSVWPASSASQMPGMGGTTGTTMGGTTKGGGAMGGAPMIPANSTLIVKQTSAGYVLATAAGKTVYWYSKDVAGSGKSACAGACLQEWPAVEGKPSAAAGVVLAGKVGSITRAPGVVQATYDGYPLYTYTGDMKPGQVTGNGLGGLWSVFSGAKVSANPPAAAAASAKAVQAMKPAG